MSGWSAVNDKFAELPPWDLGDKAQNQPGQHPTRSTG